MENNGTINSIFPNWTIKKVIGSGSYGKVYEMERVEGDAVYRSALKVISIPQNDSEIRTRLSEGESEESVRAYYADVTNNLLNENRVMAGLKGNSNIVSYEDHQVVRHENGMGSDIFIRMELLTPFVDYMADHQIDEATVIQLGIDMCKALEVCEKKKIIHRDIKPGNIFVSDTGDFKLGDFGIARTIDMTTGGLSKKGTYKYMAPEVYRGEAYGRTVDICSLGLVMYYLMNGNRTPFLPPAPTSVTYNDEENALLRRMNGEYMPPPKDAGTGFASIILKACSFDPAARYQSAAHLRADLEALRAGRFRAIQMQQAPVAPQTHAARQVPAVRQVPAAMQAPAAMQQPPSVRPSHSWTENPAYRAGRPVHGKRAGANKTKQIIIVAAVAVVIVLIGLPLLLHLTKASPNIDTNLNDENNSDVIENVKIVDVDPDISSYEVYGEYGYHTMYFDLNGGDGEIPEIDVANGDSFDVPTVIPKRDGYSFQGWYVQRTVDQKWYSQDTFDWIEWNVDASYGNVPCLYKPGTDLKFDESWEKGGVEDSNYVFHAIWY